MNRQEFLELVRKLRSEGKSIRSIATELGVHRSRVHRALKVITSVEIDEMTEESKPSSLGRLRESVFVGRRGEMDELRAALDDAVSGRPRIVILSGEPGIGKTRLAQEIALVAGDDNAQVRWGRCYEGQGAPPYWPWVQIIRACVRDREVNQLRLETAAGAANIAEIVPELREKLLNLKPPPALDSAEANRFRLFDSITTFLKNTSQRQPLVLVLEDLHWADRPSLLLLEFLAHEMSASRILVVGTLRHADSEQKLSQTLGELARESYFQQMHIPRLEMSDVEQYIQETSGAHATNDLTDAVYSRTEGNPFFMTEMVRLLAQNPSTAAQGERFSLDITMPDSVRGAVRRRLEGLSRTCDQALTIASLIGREFSLEAVGALMPDTSAHQLLLEFEETAKVRVVDELEGEVGRYQFSHVLIQEAISSELSNARKVALHAEIGEVLEALYEGGLEAHAGELAYHFGEAEPVLGGVKLVRYSSMAGDRALAAYAYEEAQTHFERALAARKGEPVDAETATILFGLGRAQLATFATAQAQEAIDTLRRAFDAFVDLGDIEIAVAAATHNHGFLAYSSGTAYMTARALDLVPSGSIEAGYLLSHYGPALLMEEKDYEGAQESLDRAVEIARREGDQVLEVRTLVYIAFMHWAQEHYSEAVEIFLPVIELAQSFDDLFALVRSRFWCADALLSIGDGKQAQIHAKAGLEAAERLHNKFWLLHNLRHNIILAIVRGEWNVAQEFIARALAESPRDAPTLAVGALLNLQAGNHEESGEYIKQVLEVVPDGLVGSGMEHSYAAVTIPLFARVTDTKELLDVAESTARRILSSPSVPSIFTSMARVGLGLIAIQRGDAESAKEQYSFLESQRGTQQLAVICHDRLLGLLAQTMGNFDDARTHFEDALAFCRKAVYRPELAWTCYDYADALIQNKGSGDDAKAISLLGEAQSISSELSMNPLVERVATLIESVHDTSQNGIAYPNGLTEREVEVLRLVASGRSNTEIAQGLVLSVRTVERHISNIYNKTGTRGRVEATAFAFTHSLITSDASA